MSKAPDTIYIKPDDTGPRVWRSSERNGDEIGYVRDSIAYGYACEVERLRQALRHIAHNAAVLTAHQVGLIAAQAIGEEK